MHEHTFKAEPLRLYETPPDYRFRKTAPSFFATFWHSSLRWPERSVPMSHYPENYTMSATKNTTKNDARSVTVKKANTKKAAMKNVGQEIAEFGVKNREAGSKARGIKKNGLATPAANTGVKTPPGKIRLSKGGSGATNPRGAKKKAF